MRRTGDPFFSGAHGHPPWLQAFLAVEGLVQLPLVACFVYDTASSPRRSSSPRAEVVGVALGALNFMGSAVCCWELHCAPPGVLSAAQKIPLLYGQYLPFAVIREYPHLRQQVELWKLRACAAGLMAVDMGGRLLARIQDAEEKEKKQ